MRLEAILWTGVTVYFGVIGVIYLAVGGDTAGVTMLLAAAGLGGIVAGWTWDWGRRHGTRVEDRADVDASDLTGVVGVYPTASLRPLALAIGVTAMAIGVPLGSWDQHGRRRDHGLPGIAPRPRRRRVVSFGVP